MHNLCMQLTETAMCEFDNLDVRNKKVKILAFSAPHGFGNRCKTFCKKVKVS